MLLFYFIISWTTSEYKVGLQINKQLSKLYSANLVLEMSQENNDETMMQVDYLMNKKLVYIFTSNCLKSIQQNSAEWFHIKNKQHCSLRASNPGRPTL